jgi:DNA-binding transcriptional LysR family regulator
VGTAPLARYRYFCKVMQLGSVRAASEALDVGPSAISRQISRLESELGVTLVEAHGRGIRITPAGEIVGRRALQVVEAMEQARADLDDLVGLRRGHVRVRTVEGSLNDLVLPAIARFRRQHPGVTFDLSITSSDRIVTALLDGETDLGVVFNPPEHPDLRVVTTVMDALNAIVHPKFEAFRSGTRVSLAELAAHPIALPDETFGLRRMVEQAAKAAGIALKPVMITDSIDALRGFARSGIGVVLLPRLAVATDLRRRAVKAIPMADRSLRVAKTKALVSATRSLSAAARAFGEALSDVSRTFAKSGFA